MTNNYFMWCGSVICEERDATGATALKRYFDKGFQVISGSSSGKYFYSKDHLDSIREFLDSTGTLRARYDYDPYGLSGKVAGDSASDFGFTGFYYHVPSGLNLAPYRPYSPVLGRWISRDPIEEVGGTNLYAYAADNPPNASDPLGLTSSLGEGFFPVQLPGPGCLGARTERNIAGLTPSLQPISRYHIELLNILLAPIGKHAEISQGTRTWEEQEDLYLNYLMGGPRAAPPGKSQHNYGAAYDIVIKDSQGNVFWDVNYYKDAGAVGKSLGLKWGGDFKTGNPDYDHFEIPP
jgi:RHS repeat-associated protein